MNHSAIVPAFHRVLCYLWRGLLLAWAGFWAWFVIAVSIGEPGPPPLWIPLAWLGSLAGLVVLCWKRPGLGGVALIVAGIGSALYFPDPGARALLAAPAIALGLGGLALRRGARSVACLAVAALASSVVGCIVSQDPADLPYRTSSILRHPDGSMKRAFLVEETVVEGMPCQRWIWWHESGAIDNVELAVPLTVQDHAFPSGTRLFFDRDGKLAHAWLSKDTVIDGLPCRGRWKIDTAFHPNGRVRAFFPPDDIEIDGVLCTASVFHPVYLHPDGRLRECKLARDVELDAQTFRQGTVLELDESGRAMR